MSILNRKSLFIAALIAFLPVTVQMAWAENIIELPRDLEIELALSALPEGLQDGATIYVRDPKKGFVLHRKGTNDFTTFIVASCSA